MILALLSGLLVGGGLWLVLRSTRRRRAESGNAAAPLLLLARLVQSWPGVALAVLLGIVTAAATSLPVLGAGVCIAVLAAPRVGSDSETDLADRADAYATWAELLRDALAAAAGVEGAIRNTAQLAPDLIRHEVTQLSANLQQMTVREALHCFAELANDSAAHDIASKLLVAAETHAGRMRQALSLVAEVQRERAADLRRASAERTPAKVSLHLLALIAAVAVALILLGDRKLLLVYEPVRGQLVLLGFEVVAGLAFRWLVSLVRATDYPRILSEHEL